MIDMSRYKPLPIFFMFLLLGDVYMIVVTNNSCLGSGLLNLLCFQPCVGEEMKSSKMFLTCMYRQASMSRILICAGQQFRAEKCNKHTEVLTARQALGLKKIGGNFANRVNKKGICFNHFPGKQQHFHIINGKPHIVLWGINFFSAN